MRRRARVALTLLASATFLTSAWMIVTRDQAVLARVRDLLAEQLTTPCTIDAAEFSFLEGLLLRGVTVYDPGDPLGPPLIHVAEARLDYVLDLTGEGPRITRISLRRPSLRVVADAEGHFPMLGVLRASREPEGATGAAPDVPLLVVDGGAVTFSHPSVLAPERTLEVGHVTLQAESVEGRGVRVRAYGNIGKLGNVRADVRTDRWSRRGAAEITLTDAIVDDEVVGLLPPSVVAALRPAAPRARVAGRLSLETLGSEVTRFDAVLDVTEGSARVALQDADDRPAPAPMQLSGVTGRVEIRRGEIVLSGVRGTVLGSRFSLAGALPADLPGSTASGADEVRVDVGIDDIPIGAEIASHLPQHLRAIQEAYALAGRAGVTLAVRGHAPFPRVDAAITIHGVSASYEGGRDASGKTRGFPWRVDGLAGRIDVVGPRVRIDARGHHGDAEVVIAGTVDATPGGLPVADLWVHAREIALDDELRAGFRERAPDIWDRWSPSGVAAAIEVHVAQGGDLPPRATATDVRITLDGRAHLLPDVLPAPLRNVRGSVQIVDAPGVSRIWVDGLSATGAGGALTADGRVITRPSSYDEDLRIGITSDAAERELIPTLLRSPRIREGTRRALLQLQPAGSVAVALTTHAGPEGRRDDVVVDLDGVRVAGWEGVPLAASDLRGRVHISTDALVTESLTGSILDGTRFDLAGRIDGLSQPRLRPRLAIVARAVPLGDRLRQALGDLAAPTAKFWETLEPGADARADVEVVVRPDDDPAGPLDADLTSMRGAVHVLGFTVAVEDGTLRYRRDGASGSLCGRLGNGTVEITGARVEAATGLVTLALAARGLAFPEDLAPLLSPESIARVASAVPGRALHVPHLDLSYDPTERVVHTIGRVSLRPRDRSDASEGLDPEGDLVVESGAIWLPEREPVSFRFDGRLERARFTAATDIEVEGCAVAATGTFPPDGASLDARFSNADILAFDLPVENGELALFVRGSRVRVEELRGTVHGGALTGSVGYGTKNLAYSGEFELHDVDLARVVGSTGDDPVRGRLHAGVRFRNPSGDAEALEGAGRADVRDGRLARVPILTPVMNGINAVLLGVAKIDGEFHSAEAKFDLRGRRVLIRDVFLAGPNLLGLGPVELRDGAGTVSLDDGRIDAVIYPRVRLDPLGLDPLGLVDRIMSAFQVFLGRLRIEGTLRNPIVASELGGGDPDAEFHPRPQPSGETLPYGDDPW